MKRRRPGRPTKYDATTVKILCRAYASGIGLRRACHVAGIAYATVKGWRTESKEHPKGPKGDLWPLLREAKAEAMLKASELAQKSDPKWWLARMDPKRFGTQQEKLAGTLAGGKGALVEQTSTLAIRIKKVLEEKEIVKELKLERKQTTDDEDEDDEAPDSLPQQE